jgi:catalase
MNEQYRLNLVNNIVSYMSGICGEKKDEIILRQLSHFSSLDSQLGMAVAQGLDIMFDEKMMKY